MYSSGHHGTFNPAVITIKENVQISEGVIDLKPLALGDNTLVDLHNSSSGRLIGVCKSAEPFLFSPNPPVRHTHIRKQKCKSPKVNWEK